MQKAKFAREIGCRWSEVQPSGPWNQSSKSDRGRGWGSMVESKLTPYRLQLPLTSEFTLEANVAQGRRF